MESRAIAILGATGSIGTTTLAVVRAHPTLLRVAGLAAHTRWLPLWLAPTGRPSQSQAKPKPKPGLYADPSLVMFVRRKSASQSQSHVTFELFHTLSAGFFRPLRSAAVCGALKCAGRTRIGCIALHFV